MTTAELREAPEHRVEHDEWRYCAQAEAFGGEPFVWLHIECGSMSGGAFLPPDKARELARAIMTAASEVAA